MAIKGKLILLRHGQSEWNRLGVFTGWVDIPLSAQGVEESKQAGKKLAGMKIDTVFTSSLIRAQMTALLALLEIGGKVPALLPSKSAILHEGCLPVYISEKLNERMYGDLEGLNKDAMREKHGKEQVQIWRRSYKIAPPGGESLEMTAARALTYFQQEIVPEVAHGNTVFVVAHGNSLRAIMMALDGLSEQQVVDLEIPTGRPIIYNLLNENVWEKLE